MSRSFAVSSSRTCARAAAKAQTTLACAEVGWTNQRHIGRDRSSCRARLDPTPHRTAILGVDDLRRKFTQRLRRGGVDVSYHETRGAGFHFHLYRCCCLGQAASTRSSATRSAIIAAPSSVHDRAGIVLDDLGRKLPQARMALMARFVDQSC